MSPIKSANKNIGRRQIGLKVKEKPVEREAPISKLATTEIKRSSTDATRKEIKH